MIDQSARDTLKGWLEDYIRGFVMPDPDRQRNIDLKNEHTAGVCEAILDVGASLGLNESDLRLAEITAMFHDVGRFEQYRQYGTFVDRKSVNHAMLGVRILGKLDVLKNLDRTSVRTILTAIANHNRFRISDAMTGRNRLFSKLLRDADKIDIYRVMMQYYQEKSAGVTNDTVEMDLPPEPGMSADMCRDILAGRIAKTGDMRNQNDFRLLQLGWVYDINFQRSREIILEKKYVDRIISGLPHTDTVRKIREKIIRYLHQP